MFLARYYKNIQVSWGCEIDMANGCKEQFDLEFLHFVLTFNSKFKKGIIQKLNLVKDEKKVRVFKTDKQADKFLAQISEFK